MKLHKSILDLFPHHTSMYDVDYQSSLDGSEDAIQEAIEVNEFYPIDEKFDEWFMEMSVYSLDYYTKELVKSLVDNFDVDKERAEEFVDKYRDLIEEELFNRDWSHPMDDLIRHTGNIVAFYDTGEYFDQTWYLPWKEISKEQTRLCKFLGIKKADHQKQLDDLFANATSGGRLVIFFTLEPKQFIGISPEPTKIEFSYPHIAIIDTYNGSGFDVQLNCKIILPFNRENIILDKTIKYNYTYAVCGMSSDWCDDTGVHLLYKKSRKTLPPSGVHSQVKVDNELTAKFKKTGECTFGDMDRQRHKQSDLIYINDFPCGTRCKKCHTFWID